MGRGEGQDSERRERRGRGGGEGVEGHVREWERRGKRWKGEIREERGASITNRPPSFTLFSSHPLHYSPTLSSLLFSPPPLLFFSSLLTSSSDISINSMCLYDPGVSTVPGQIAFTRILGGREREERRGEREGEEERERERENESA